MIRRRHQSNGFTIIELMVTLAVLIVLLGIAIPNVRTLVTNSQLESAEDLIVEIFYRAKRSASGQGVPLSVVLNADGNRLDITGPQPESFGFGTVTLSSSGDNVFDYDAEGMISAADVNVAITISSNRDSSHTQVLSIGNTFGQIIKN